MKQGLKKFFSPLKNQRGQTLAEYLMLLSVAFITSYILVTGPIANYTQTFLEHVSTGIKNVVQSAEWQKQPIEIGNERHPSSPKRFKALHL